ncbi:MAG: sulfite exporter TauE/SafE family protein [Acidiferrobacterales bacterium]
MTFLIMDPYIWLLATIFLAAILYSSVGHGGASGYIAMMALFGLSAQEMKPAALVMNIFVASVVLVKLYRAGHFNTQLFVPLALASVPMAYLGGAYTIDDPTYKYVVGAALLLAAVRFLVESGDRPATGTPTLWIALPVGVGIGFLAGLTGVGGGIFLSPILLFLRWTNMRTNAAIAAAFVLSNSIAGLLGHVSVITHWPTGLSILVVAALLGGLIGSELATRRLAPVRLRNLLGLVLIIAGVKMFITAQFLIT